MRVERALPPRARGDGPPCAGADDDPGHYNLRSGGAGWVHWSKVADEFAPDLFLVQEAAAPEDHLPSLADPGMRGRVTWRNVEGRRSGSAVRVGRGEARAIDLPDFRGHVVGVEVVGGRRPGDGVRPLRTFSVHAPIRDGYRRAVIRILDVIAVHAGGDDLVIGGDFNVSVGGRHASEARATSAAGRAIQRRLRDEFGLANCRQEANPGRPLAQTLRWSNAPAVPYHCDGLFVPRSWLPHLRSCDVIASPEWDALSDHNPVVARFEG